MNTDDQIKIDELQKCIAENTAVYDSDSAQDVAETLYYTGYRRASDVVAEIFSGIEQIFFKYADVYSKKSDTDLLLEPLRQAKMFLLNEIFGDVTELKKKYEETCNG